MTAEPQDQGDRKLRELEAELGGELRRSLHPPEAEPPARVDAAVAEMIRIRAQEVRAQISAGRRLRRWPAWAAAAAAALVVAAGTWAGLTLGRRPGPTGYFDGRGAPDIVDAYRLSRWLESSAPAEPSWDFNGDGRADRADVEALARRAVALSPEGR